jgi:D-alanyl-D-alanine carboxypeptidase
VPVDVNLADPRRADARGWGPMWSPDAPRRTDMVPLVVAGVSFIGGVHPRLHDLLETLWTEAISRGYELKTDPTQTWGFAWRAIRGATSTPTNHSSGTAVDANSKFNWLGRADGGDVPRWLVEIFNRYGFRWGGDYSGRKDPMHWEFMGTMEDARDLTERARNEFGGDELTPEEKATLKRLTTFLDALTKPLKPGEDEATAKGAGERVARAVLQIEHGEEDMEGVEH